VLLTRVLLARGDPEAAAALARAEEQMSRLETRELPPRIEKARAELARARGDAATCERALREAARLHRANGEPWLAIQAESRI
jgi:hypothetical protein